MSALLLIASLLLPFAQLAFSADPEAQLPACCRLHGRHQCAMRMMEDASSPQLARIGEKCPFSRAVASSAHTETLWDGSGSFIAILMQREWAQAAAITAIYISSPAHANHKRGPPASSTFA